MGKVSIGAGLVLGVLLAGCGGGGDSNSSSSALPLTGDRVPTVLRAEGVYTGTLSNGEKHETIVLENGQIFMIHAGSFNIQNTPVLEGSGKADNGSYTSMDLKDFSDFAVFTPASMTASYNLNGTLNGSISKQGSVVSFTSSRLEKPTYNYDEPASPASIVVAEPNILFSTRITLDGDISISARQCSARGTIKPRASGKNVFDIRLTFLNGPICPLNAQTHNGVAYMYLTSFPDGSLHRRLVMMGTDASRTYRFSYYDTLPD